MNTCGHDDGCDRAVKARGLCQRHYDRERARHRHRDDRLVHTRARNRAASELIQRHRVEFEDILVQKLVEAKAEHEELKASVGRKVLRLMPGPRPDDQELVDRVTREVGRCAKCRGFHADDHQCPVCVERAKQRRPLGDERIMRALRAGKSPEWVRDNLGEPASAIRAVLRKMQAETA